MSKYNLNLLDGTHRFMRWAGQDTTGGGFSDKNTRNLRTGLLIEELGEYIHAEATDDLVEVVDGLLDVIVVAYGTLLSYVGHEAAERAAAEVTRSNLDKVERGVIRNAAGKILKPTDWTAPDIANAIKDGW